MARGWHSLSLFLLLASSARGQGGGARRKAGKQELLVTDDGDVAPDGDGHVPRVSILQKFCVRIDVLEVPERQPTQPTLDSATMEVQLAEISEYVLEYVSQPDCSNKPVVNLADFNAMLVDLEGPSLLNLWDFVFTSVAQCPGNRTDVPEVEDWVMAEFKRLEDKIEPVMKAMPKIGATRNINEVDLPVALFVDAAFYGHMFKWVEAAIFMAEYVPSGQTPTPEFHVVVSESHMCFGMCEQSVPLLAKLSTGKFKEVPMETALGEFYKRWAPVVNDNFAGAVHRFWKGLSRGRSS